MTLYIFTPQYLVILCFILYAIGWGWICVRFEETGGFLVRTPPRIVAIGISGLMIATAVLGLFWGMWTSWKASVWRCDQTVTGELVVPKQTSEADRFYEIDTRVFRGDPSLIERLARVPPRTRVRACVHGSHNVTRIDAVE